MVLIAFVLRAAYILLLHTYRFKPVEHNFSFGWEMGSVGHALAAGRGFSDPFGVETGPTAWEPPLYPFLIALVFKTFGIFTNASAIVLLLINSTFSALTCVPIFLIARYCFGEKVAVWSAWTWALLPYIMYWCSRWVWETSLSALLLTTILWLALSMQDKGSIRPWLEFGALWGIAALSSPVLLAFLPFSGLWAWYHRAREGKRSFGGIVVASLIFFACVIPWGIRNQRTMGKFIFIRDNFGAELRLGNGPWADGTWMYFLHPTQNVFEMHRYRELGELPYIAERKKEAVEFVREDPLRFILVSAKRFIYYWGGVPRASEIWWLAETKNSLFLASSVLAFWGLGRAIRRRRRGAWLLFLLFISYPTIYYFVFPHPRYRHPIEPAMLILGAFLLSEARSKVAGTSS
jgi:4-amino-4-deoxy-L-arabinose transferase-like glycosyltransferase